MEIKSADELLSKVFGNKSSRGFEVHLKVRLAMKQYTEQYLRLAAERATAGDNKDYSDKVNKDSILDIIKELK